MIRLATVFSGIGAIEHALDRMGLDHKVVFACDNGDLDIFAKDIALNMDEIGPELRSLSLTIGNIQFNDEYEDLYKEQLSKMLDEALQEYTSLQDTLKTQSDLSNQVKAVLLAILSMETAKKTRLKEYRTFLADLEKGSIEQRRLKEFQIILEIVNDFKKDNSLEDLGKEKDFVSSDEIEWKCVSEQLGHLYESLEAVNGKRIIRKVQDLSQRTGQLHEKITYMKIQKTLESMGDDWNARKAYVDSLYDGLDGRNKVKQSYMANYDLDNKDFHWNVAFLNGHQYEGQVDLFVGGSHITRNVTMLSGKMSYQERPPEM